MKKKNLNFKDIKTMLSRDEMRQIKGGSGLDDCTDCSSDSDCKSSICPRCVYAPGNNASGCTS